MKKYIMPGIWVALLIAWGGLILYLSFQNGTDTAATSMHLTERLLAACGVDISDGATLAVWDHRLRVAAHMATFYVYGLLGAILFAPGETGGNRVWLYLFLLSGILLAAWSEAGKVLLHIPGRHCDFGEMMLNFCGLIVGYALHAILFRTMRTHRGTSG